MMAAQPTDPSSEPGAEPSAFSVPPPPDVHPELRVASQALPESALDEDAVKVVRRLEQHGFEAYLVGGCIRDLLLGRTPKDFDIATSARPAEMRRLFRNCRLIGRRFRLAHLHFRDRKIIEVATFRRAPTAEDDVTERHAAENLFGCAADDALRRDFTINALMYDVSRRQILDWVDGLGDIDRRVIRTIGEPSRRFKEDPVRIVRAAKFSELLGLGFEESMPPAMAEGAPLIPTCAPARLFEEILKILRSGAAARCLERFGALGILPHVLPGLDQLRGSLESPADTWRALARCDALAAQGRTFSEAVLIASMLHEGCKGALESEGDVAPILDEALAVLTAPIPFTRRHMSNARQILLALRRLKEGPRTRRARRILSRDFAADALDLLEVTADGEEALAMVAAWRSAFTPAAAPEEGGERSRPPRRRRARRRRASLVPSPAPEPEAEPNE
jgi:poly(A) polymerase